MAELGYVDSTEPGLSQTAVYVFVIIIIVKGFYNFVAYFN